MASQQQLDAWFAAVDKDGSGHLNVVELQSCLAQSGLNFSMKCAASARPRGDIPSRLSSLTARDSVVPAQAGQLAHPHVRHGPNRDVQQAGVFSTVRLPPEGADDFFAVRPG